ncbi:carotenoid ester lipase [Agrocybe pediades]|nr:carotenoid ester lipase [Agrocybe pediades]
MAHTAPSFLSLTIPLAAAWPLALRDLSDSPPTVTLDSATVTGINQGNLSKFLGIPFAQPPIGDLRFRHPVPITSYNGSINASSYGYSCPQQNATFPISLGDIVNFTVPNIPSLHNNRSSNNATSGLTINIIKPSNVSADAKLPVLVWIFGGGFERGNAQGHDEQAERIVNRSVEIGQPVIYAAMNYRQEVLEAGVGNAGWVDQRVALQWIQKYIGLFGGDNQKVSLWGQSAGAISATLQMLAYDGNGTDLFRGAFMQSGAQIPVGNITGGQIYYDQVANLTNCTGTNDTLACLRTVPLDDLRKAVDQTPSYFNYTALSLAWSPRADGTFLTQNPQRLVEQGKVMNIPIVNGNVDDEGTVFSLSSLNVTTDEQFREYVSTVFVPNATQEELEPLWNYYPSDPADGSPFNTSNFNDITPQYKRIAAFQGDVVFQAQRRYLLQHLSGKQKLWSYLSRRDKLVPVVGSFHGSALELGILDDYIIRFTNNLDPNSNSTSLRDRETRWPEYTGENPQLLTFPVVRGLPLEITNDTYREEPMRFLMNLSLAHPL